MDAAVLLPAADAVEVVDAAIALSLFSEMFVSLVMVLEGTPYWLTISALTV